MTLPTTKPISMSQVAAELGLSFPLSLTDSRVRALAGKATGTISLTDLLGKTASGIVNPINGGTLMNFDIAIVTSSTTTLAVRVYVYNDGTIVIKRTTATSGDTYLYYSPKTDSIGSSYYVKCVVSSMSSGTTRAGSSVNTVIACSSVPYWTFSISGLNEYSTVNLILYFYSDSAGTTQVTSGSIKIAMEIAS